MTNLLIDNEYTELQASTEKFLNFCYFFKNTNHVDAISLSSCRIQEKTIANASFYKSVRSQQMNLSMLIQLYSSMRSSSIETNLFRSKKIKMIWTKTITTINQKILSNKALIRLYEVKCMMMLIFRNVANLF